MHNCCCGSVVGGTRPGGSCCVYIPHLVPLSSHLMLSIEDITNTLVVRDDPTPDQSQFGLTRVLLIDSITSHLLGSITYNREHGFNLEWNTKEAFKAWLENEQTTQSIELQPSKIEQRSALYSTNQIF